MQSFIKMSYQASKYVILLIAMLAGVQLTGGVSKRYSCLLTRAEKRSKATYCPFERMKITQVKNY